jgi:hypothetical protein
MNDKETIAELEAENAALKQALADAESGMVGIPREIRALVIEKRAAGLDLSTAVKAAKAQVAWDAEQKAAEKETPPKP